MESPGDGCHACRTVRRAQTSKGVVPTVLRGAKRTAEDSFADRNLSVAFRGKSEGRGHAINRQGKPRTSEYLPSTSAARRRTLRITFKFQPGRSRCHGEYRLCYIVFAYESALHGVRRPLPRCVTESIATSSRRKGGKQGDAAGQTFQNRSADPPPLPVPACTGSRGNRLLGWCPVGLRSPYTRPYKAVDRVRSVGLSPSICQRGARSTSWSETNCPQVSKRLAISAEECVQPFISVDASTHMARDRVCRRSIFLTRPGPSSRPSETRRIYLVTHRAISSVG